MKTPPRRRYFASKTAAFNAAEDLDTTGEPRYDSVRRQWYLVVIGEGLSSSVETGRSSASK